MCTKTYLKFRFKRQKNSSRADTTSQQDERTIEIILKEHWSTFAVKSQRFYIVVDHSDFAKIMQEFCMFRDFCRIFFPHLVTEIKSSSAKNTRKKRSSTPLAVEQKQNKV